MSYRRGSSRLAVSGGRGGGGGGHHQSFQTLLDYEYSSGHLIGHGAFALVFRGRHKRTLEMVAIKQISLKSVPDHLSIRQKEIEILKEIKHRNVVQLLDYHEDKAHIFLVMEYCNGGDLGDYLQAKHTLSEDSIRHLTNHIANALNTLHSQHIIHRDIKPQNLLLSYPPHLSSSSSSSSSFSSSGRNRTITDAIIKLADFGFARHLKGTDMAATLCGSPLYMAPEILLGEKYDGKADLWSVGTILFQCLSGSAPFVANNPYALKRRYEKEKLVAKVPEGTSRHLSSLLTKLLRKNPRDRLGHDDLLRHPFLADPSIQASGYLMMTTPQPRAKSSPVPIRRHTPSPSPSPSPYTSARLQSNSQQSPYDVFVSPSSGPPSIHPVGSASSLARQHHSPHSDITDHGFVLVESPHLSSSPLSTTSSPRSGSYGSCRSRTPSSSGHTPSSYGSSSMQRFRSLTTPFYQAPPTTRSSATPTIRPSDVIASNTPPNITSETIISGRSRSQSSSCQRRSLELNVGVAPPLSHTPPFGRLMQLAVAPATTQSPPSLHSRQLSSPSPSSSSPSSGVATTVLQTSHAHRGIAQKNVGVSGGGVRQARGGGGGRGSGGGGGGGGRGGGGGMRYSLSAHGSGSKLSSLTEHSVERDNQRREKPRERQRRSNQKRKNSPSSNKRGTSLSAGRSERRVSVDNLITTSQILQSDEEEEEEDVEFPLSLSLQSSQSSSETDEQEGEEEEEEVAAGEEEGGGGEELEGGGGSQVSTPRILAKSSTSARSSRPRRCQSARYSGSGGGRRGGDGRRSFSRQHSEALSENFQQINNRAVSLSSHQSWLETSNDSSSTTTAAAITSYTFQVSPSPEIKPVTPTFQLPRDVASGDPLAKSRSPVASDLCEHEETDYGAARRREKEQKEGGGGGGGGGGGRERQCLAPLRRAVTLASELAAMAQARQGPIMLLSTDITSSGSVSQNQRYSEQLVLYAKAISLLDSGLRQFQIETATSSLDLDLSTLKTGEMEAVELQESCVERARQIQEEMGNSRTPPPLPPLYPRHQLSAERLLLLESLDMCKHAVLGEQAGDNKECVKKYRIAKLIFSHLLSESKTQRDHITLSNYIQSVTLRIQRLSN